MPLRRLAALCAALALLGAAPVAASAAPVPREDPLYEDGPDGRHLLAEGWTTRADPRDAGLRAGWWRRGRDRGFRGVSVPHAFNGSSTSARGFRSRVQWYRARFDRPRDRRAVSWRLRFESVNREATVWLNGRRLGRHEGAHLPFELPARGLRARDNELVVRVDGRGSRTDLPPSTRPRGWWNHGGILREVYLRRVAALDGADLHVRALPGDPAVLDWELRVRNSSRRAREPRYRVELRDPDGRPLGGAEGGGSALRPGRLTRIVGDFELGAVREWSPQDPALYRLEVELAGGQRLTAHVGFRRWGVDGQGRATLNGRPLELRGASFHEETPARGAALRPSDRNVLVDELRAIAADFTREHYPPHPALLEAFDRAGIVFWEQIPVWRLRNTQLRSRRVRREALSRLRRAILRDRNHASVIAWSVENETLRGGEGQERYVRAAASLARRLDGTRLVAADTSLRPLRDIPDVYSVLDAIGVNEYVGWYGDAPSAELAGDLAELRRRFPRQALFVTEFGAEANREGPASEKGTYAFQRRWLGEHLDVVDRSPELSGALVWILRDFRVRPGWAGGNPRPSPPWNHKGLFDRLGRPKPAAELVRERFAAVPWTGGPPAGGGGGAVPGLP